MCIGCGSDFVAPEHVHGGIGIAVTPAANLAVGKCLTPSVI